MLRLTDREKSADQRCHADADGRPGCRPAPRLMPDSPTPACRSLRSGWRESLFCIDPAQVLEEVIGRLQSSDAARAIKKMFFKADEFFSRQLSHQIAVDEIELIYLFMIHRCLSALNLKVSASM